MRFEQDSKKVIVTHIHISGGRTFQVQGRSRHRVQKNKNVSLVPWVRESFLGCSASGLPFASHCLRLHKMTMSNPQQGDGDHRQITTTQFSTLSHSLGRRPPLVCTVTWRRVHPEQARSPLAKVYTYRIEGVDLEKNNIASTTSWRLNNTPLGF